MRSFLFPLLREALGVIGAPAGGGIPLGPPREAGHGDMATSVALALAREPGDSPRAIAARIVAALRVDPRYLERPEITEAGFINFRFTPAFFQMRLAGALALGDRFGRLDIGKGARATVDYVRVSPSAPLHGGACRTQAAGDAIANILEWCGYDVIRSTVDFEAGGRGAGAIVVGRDGGERSVNVNQAVTFVEGGKRVAAAEGAGGPLTLDALIEDPGAEVIRFFLVMRSVNAPIELDLSLAREHSERNPYFYLRYAHARVAGVLRHVESEGIALSGDAQLALLTRPEELDLIKALLHFPEKIERAANDLDPQIIADYLRDLATTFNRFHHACRVVAESPPIRDARIHLLIATRTTLGNGMRLLGVAPSPPPPPIF